MIKNLASTIRLYCGNHNEPIEFDIKDGYLRNMDSFYACKKYYDYNREPDEKQCNNNLTFTDYLRFISKLEKELTEDAINGIETNLTNKVFKIGKIEYTIFKHTDKSIKVSVINLKAINK